MVQSVAFLLTCGLHAPGDGLSAVGGRGIWDQGELGEGHQEGASVSWQACEHS